MEHIIQFGINLDDESIKEGIIAHAQKEIVKQVTGDLDHLLLLGNYYPTKPNDLTQVAKKIFMEWLDHHQELIVEKTVESMTERLLRTKKVKEYIISATIDNPTGE